MGYKHDREDLLAAGVAIAIEEGLPHVSFRRIANRVGLPDRTVVYYFRTKDVLVEDVVLALAGQLQELLDVAFGGDPVDPDALLRRAWPRLARDEHDRILGIHLQVLGLAASGQRPYPSLALTLTRRWIDALVPRLTGDDERARRKQAIGVIARLDGLLMLRQVGGPDVATTAARELAVVD